jgi:hypothetical protein
MSEDESEIRVEDEQGEKIKSKRTHPVWDYFNILAEKKQWTCKLCKRPKVFNYTTECPSSTKAKEHLQSMHKKEHEIVSLAEKDLPPKKRKAPSLINSDPKQPKLSFSQVKYSPENAK